MKLTEKEFARLRRRPDRATLTVQAGKRDSATRTEVEIYPYSLANVAGSMGYSKFGAKPVVISGTRFASGAEGRRYLALRALEAAGQIEELELQPRFPFEIAGERMFTYVGDFTYKIVKTQERIVEDVKGVKTPVYKLKKKIIEKYYGIKITETRGMKR